MKNINIKIKIIGLGPTFSLPSDSNIVSNKHQNSNFMEIISLKSSK